MLKSQPDMLKTKPQMAKKAVILAFFFIFLFFLLVFCLFDRAFALRLNRTVSESFLTLRPRLEGQRIRCENNHAAIKTRVTKRRARRDTMLEIIIPSPVAWTACAEAG